ncbi:hypothetical protein ACRE_055530 [Hapsidospora chrysogenum ATCC 11550]|uniref:Uncharacterized protein n=1 Tax=Hapsidospora chrysogenum (strain ATCC 11550 / CBS 779.69 / DSM 880 / IAM 14645 / JCM 23072 / IMI 49137) TaxID=857340 RepID=A0A086T2V1_HAPC1|nr:hypothetical protein ACRE_055530 [Hapsidospora chrysogenum ATCC 11550]
MEKRENSRRKENRRLARGRDATCMQAALQEQMMMGTELRSGLLSLRAAASGVRVIDKRAV